MFKSLKSGKRRNSVNMANAEKPKDIDYDGLIGDLIQKIDNKEKSLFTSMDTLRVFRTILLYLVFILVLITSTEYIPSISLADRLVIFFAGLAVLLSLLQIEIPSIKEKVIDVMYNRAVKNFKVSKDDKPLLMALIKMKSENSKFTLTEIRKMCPEMFTIEKLLERLYEQSR